MTDMSPDNNLPEYVTREVVPVTKRDRGGAYAWSLIDENMGPFLMDFVHSLMESGLTAEYEETDQGYEIKVDGYYLLTIKVERLLND